MFFRNGDNYHHASSQPHSRAQSQAPRAQHTMACLFCCISSRQQSLTAHKHLHKLPTASPHVKCLAGWSSGGFYHSLPSAPCHGPHRCVTWTHSPNTALPAARFGSTHFQLKCETFRLPCMESGVGLDHTPGSLPTQKILWYLNCKCLFYLNTLH